MRNLTRATARRGTLVAALAVTAVLVGACGSSGSTTSAKSSETTTAAKTSGGSAKDVDPCALVPIETVEKLLGGPVAKPHDETRTNGTRVCVWQLKASVDTDDPQQIGHMLTLSVMGGPDPEISPEDFFEAASKSATAQASVCDKSFWLEGTINALQNGVYLSAMAGLASAKPEAKDAAEKLMVAACASL